MSSHCIGLSFFVISLLFGCSSANRELESLRTSSQQLFAEGTAAFDSRDYSIAEKKFSESLQQGGLHPDAYDIAAVKRAVCWGALNRGDEALAELSKLEPGSPNPDAVYAARSYVLAKQGKLVESRAALAKARQYNRAVHEFKD